MRSLKKQYEKPLIVDQGSLVDLTQATQCGQCWDGSPDTNDDTRDCDSEVIEIQ